MELIVSQDENKPRLEREGEAKAEPKPKESRAGRPSKEGGAAIRKGPEDWKRSEG